MIGTNRNISGFDPRNLAKCCLWLDGADPKTMFSDVAGTTNSTLNGAIALWKDKSDARADVSNATSARQPTYTSAGVSYYSLSNSGKGLYGVPPVLSSGGLSAFVVYNPTSMNTGTGRKCMVRLYTQGGYLVGLDNWYSELSIPGAYAYRYVQTVTGSNILMTAISYNRTVNNFGTPITQLGWDIGNLGSTTWVSFKGTGTNFGSLFSIGEVSSINSFDGTISEVIIYDSFLSVDQKELVQRYLSQKWNTQQQAVTPRSIANCFLWNDASSLTGTGTVGTWPNPAGTTTVACGGTKTPNGRNGLMTVRLTTAQTWVPNPVVALPAYTLFWSGRETGGYFGSNRRILQGTSNNHLYGYWGNQKRVLYHNAVPGFLSGAPADTEWDTFSTSRVAEGAYTFSWNGSLLYSGSTSTGSWMDGLVINTGASPGEETDCEIGEIILYNRVLNTDERTLIEVYLDNKWNRSQKYALNFPLDTVNPRLRVFQPTDFRDCYCWIDAAQDTSNVGSTVSTLRDWSGNAPTIAPLSPGTITLQANGLNGRPVYNFGTSRAMSDPTFTWNSSFTQFAVVQSANGYWMAANLVPANNLYYNYSFAGNWFLYTDSAMVLSDNFIPSGVNNRSIFEVAAGGKSSWVIFSIGHQSGDSNLNNYTVNGKVMTSTVSNAGSALINVGKLMLNGNGSSTFDTSSVAEFIHYNRSLSDGERQEVEGYLSRKWNIPLNVVTSFTSPTSVTGCVTWLDAADPATTTNLATGVWVDKGSRASNTTSNAGGGAFSISSINSVRAIAFPTAAGTAALIQSNYGLSTVNGISGFMVVQPLIPPSGQSWLMAGFGNSGGFFNGDILGLLTSNAATRATRLSLRSYPSTTPTTAVYTTDIPLVISWSMIWGDFSTGVAQVFSNGLLCVSNNIVNSNILSNVFIGNSNVPGASTAFTGVIGEFILYNNVVSEANRKNIENYLMKKWRISNHPYDILPTAVSSTFVPSTLSRCQLWLDGADPAGTGVRPAANSTVSTWVDKSGNMNNGTAVGTPTFLTEGGINLNGSSYFSNRAFRMTFANRSMFFVMQETSRTNNNGIFVFIPSPSNSLHDYEASSGIVYETVNGFQTFWRWTPGDPVSRIGYTYSMGTTSLLPRGIYNDNMNTVVGSGFVNGSNAANRTADASATTSSGYVVGGRYIQPNITNPLNGIIYEIIAYDRGLTTPERQQVEGYLAWKWNLNSSLPTNHPFYKVSPGPTLRSIMINPDELYLWLDASDLSTLFQNPVGITPVTTNGQTVGVWYDKSGKQRHYTSFSGTYPTYSTKSQVPELEFRTAGTNMTCKWLPPGCRGLDLFVVTQPLTSTADWRTLFRGNINDHHVIIQAGTFNLGAFYNAGGGFQQYGSGTLDGTRRVILHVSFATGGAQAGSINILGQEYDGTTVMSAANSTNANDNIYWLGGINNVQPWGNISEVIVFQRNLTNPEKVEVYNYLNAKWFTRVTLRNAIDYLPLATNTTNLGTTPQTVTTVGSVSYGIVGGKACASFPNSFGTYLRLPYTNPAKFTICFWLRPGDSTYYTAISITNSAISSPALQVDTISSTQVRVFAALPNNWNFVTGSSAVTTWTHYAVTINQITFVEELYVNGSRVDTTTGTGSALGTRDTFVLGRSGDGSRAYFGQIRQFVVFNTILTPYEVRDIYLATID
jgi:hypothetical protein